MRNSYLSHRFIDSFLRILKLLILRVKPVLLARPKGRNPKSTSFNRAETGSNPSDINRIQSLTGKVFISSFLKKILNE